MKSLSVKMLVFVVLLGAVMTSCKDKESEKKIAELEAKIADLEGGTKATKPKGRPVNKVVAKKPAGPLPQFKWESTEHDFGTMKEGDKVSYTYKFKNTGAVPLIIESVRPSCGCTAPNWTKVPIPVGGEGSVDVLFNSKGKPNAQNKTVTVSANTWPQTTVLRFKAFVTPAKKK
jgi:outer membrane lipoprotein-sorting protein